jgi:hypothetical protein
MNSTTPDQDPIGSLIREEGLLSPSAGFTDRVMQQITADARSGIAPYKPLLSRRWWVLIFTAGMLMVVTCIAWFSVHAGNQTGLLHKLNLLGQLEDGLRLNPGPTFTGSLLLATLILDAIVLLLLMDYYLQKRVRNTL